MQKHIDTRAVNELETQIGDLLKGFDPVKKKESMSDEELKELNINAKNKISEKFEEIYPSFEVLTNEQVELHDYILKTEKSQFEEASIGFEMHKVLDKLLLKNIDVSITIDTKSFDGETTSGDILRGVLTMEQVNKDLIGDQPSIEDMEMMESKRFKKLVKKMTKKKPRVRDVLKRKR